LPVVPVPVFAAMVVAGTPVVAPLSIVVVLVVAVAVAIEVALFSVASVTVAVGVGALEVVFVTKAALLVAVESSRQKILQKFEKWQQRGSNVLEVLVDDVMVQVLLKAGEHGTGEKAATAHFQSPNRDGGLTIKGWKMTERTEAPRRHIAARSGHTGRALKELSTDVELEIWIVL
jgi:hypothetical protein